MQYDNNSLRHVGYEHTNPYIESFFSKTTVNMLSRQITHLLQGVDKRNRPIIVPDKTILDVMNNIYSSFRPATGDIHSRYIVPAGGYKDNYLQSMVDQTLEVIVNEVRSTMLAEEANSKLTAWTTTYGDFNEHGLRQHAPIKINNKRPTSFQFHMNY